MSKSLKQQVAEKREQSQQRLSELQVEIAQGQEKLQKLSQQMQDVQQQTALLINEKRGMEIALEQLAALGEEE